MKWEYTKIVFKEIHAFMGVDYLDELNHLGNDGWELISAINTTSVLVFIFKRPTNKNV